MSEQKKDYGHTKSMQEEGPGGQAGFPESYEPFDTEQSVKPADQHEEKGKKSRKSRTVAAKTVTVTKVDRPSFLP